jgi:predicted MPP superfamily phosphohydrolase
MWIILRLLIGITLLLAVELYFIKKTNLSVKTFFPIFYQKKYLVIRRIFLIWLNLYPVALIIIFIYFAISGEYVSSPDNKLIDYLLIYPFWCFFILTTQVGIYFLIIDFLKLLLLPYYRKHRDSFLRIQSIVVLVLVGFFIIYIPLRVIYDYNAVSVRTVEFKKESLPDALNNFKIAFISDIQADHYTDEGRLGNFINKVNELNPDLVLIAGDLITTGPKYIELSAKEVGKLKAKYGVYSCVGDHDNWAYRNDYKRSITEVKNSLMHNNVEMIDNGERMINVDGAEIGITFITNTYVSKVDGDILDTLSSGCSGDLKIFLTHQPRPYLIEAAQKNHFDLYLCGHTHGGQLSLVFPFIQLTPTLIETKYIQGNFWFGDPDEVGTSMLMVVTRGLGMSLAPLRYNSTPEITLITLRNN